MFKRLLKAFIRLFYRPKPRGASRIRFASSVHGRRVPVVVGWTTFFSTQCYVNINPSYLSPADRADPKFEPVLAAVEKCKTRGMTTNDCERVLIDAGIPYPEVLFKLLREHEKRREIKAAIQVHADGSYETIT